MGTETVVEIVTDGDIVAARQTGRQLALQLGFTSPEATLVATAISEVARNIIRYAVKGEVVLDVATRGGRKGIVVIARDKGPGIPDIPRAMQDGYTTGKGLGLGLPGARRMMTDFEIESRVGEGTTITMRKWVGG